MTPNLSSVRLRAAIFERHFYENANGVNRNVKSNMGRAAT